MSPMKRSVDCEVSIGAPPSVTAEKFADRFRYAGPLPALLARLRLEQIAAETKKEIRAMQERLVAHQQDEP